MTNEKIKAIFDYLCDELDRGNHFLQIFKTLEESYENNKLVGAPYFFAGVYDACLRETVLSLAKLLIPNKESINIYYLLNIAIHYPELFQFADPNLIKNTITRHQMVLENLQPFIDEVRILRDQLIAHLDRKHVNNPTKIVSDQINLTEAERSFDILLEMIKTYMDYFGAGDFSFGIVGVNVKQEVEYILNLMANEYK